MGEPAVAHSESLLAEQISDAASRAGLGESPFELLDTGHNIVFANHTDRVIARIAAGYFPAADLGSQLASARRAFDAGAPIVPPLLSEPADLDGGRRATFWPMADPPPGVDGHDMAGLAAGFHQTDPFPGLEIWHPRMRAAHRYASLRRGRRRGLPAEIGGQLEQLFAQALDQLDAAFRASQSPAVLVHGDFYHRNIVALDGELRLCDADNLCLGPAEADLAYIACNSLGPLPAEHWDQCRHTYPHGCDQDLLRCLVRVQQVGGIMFGAAFWKADPERRGQIARQIDDLDRHASALLDR